MHKGRIHARMETWKGGKLHMIDGAEHEVLMEIPATRDKAVDEMAALFFGNAKK